MLGLASLILFDKRRKNKECSPIISIWSFQVHDLREDWFGSGILQGLTEDLWKVSGNVLRAALGLFLYWLGPSWLKSTKSKIVYQFWKDFYFFWFFLNSAFAFSYRTWLPSRDTTLSAEVRRDWWIQDPRVRDSLSGWRMGGTHHPMEEAGHWGADLHPVQWLPSTRGRWVWRTHRNL